MNLVLWLVVCCGEKEIPNDQSKNNKKEFKSHRVGSAGIVGIQLVIIDSCEYLVVVDCGIIHKANCINHK